VAFLVRHILNIIGSLIKTERIFLLVGIVTNLKKCHLQSDNLNKIIFLLVKIDLVILGWVCSSRFSLIELIEANVALQEELEQYEDEFEQNEFLDL